MPVQFSVSYDPGFTVYGLVLDPLERAWNGTAFVDPTGVRPTCSVAMIHNGLSGAGSAYVGDVPSSVPIGSTGTYTVRAYLQLGADPDDSDPPIGDGTVTIPSAAVARTSNDRDFLAELTDTVAIEFDENSAGEGAGAHPGHPSDWQPVTGLESVACLVEMKGAVPIDGGSIRVGSIWFGREVLADKRHSALFTGGGFGVIRLYFSGPVIESMPPGHHWTVDFQDAPLS